jgi:hypothetical protein
MLLKKMRQKQLIDKAIRLSSDEEQQAYDCLEKEKPGAGECQRFGLTLFAEYESSLTHLAAIANASSRGGSAIRGAHGFTPGT